jgi:lipopolysaccharide export system permease protein
VSWILFRYVARTYLTLFVGVFATVLAVFLVADFVDNANAFSGPKWGIAVAELYWHKLLVSSHQLGPAAILLAAGATISVLRKRGESTAMGSLAFGFGAFYVPIAAMALALSLSFTTMGELVVVKSARRIDDIMLGKFGRWGDWRFYFTPKQWFRKKDRIFYLRQGDPDRGYTDVTVLTVSPDFRLTQRLDAEKMTHVSGTVWELSGVLHRQFGAEGTTTLRTMKSGSYDFDVLPSAFRIIAGRPEQMRVKELRDQIATRQGVGLPIGKFALALHNRLAYPLAAIPAALLAVGLALRNTRKGSLTTALFEGLLVVVCFWGMMVVFKTMVLSEHIPPWGAAWAPVAVLVVAATFVFLRREFPVWRAPALQLDPPGADDES